MVCDEHPGGKNSFVVDEKQRYLFGQSAQFVCHEGFRHDDGASSLHCVGNNTWEPSTPLNCKRKWFYQLSNFIISVAYLCFLVLMLSVIEPQKQENCRKTFLIWLLGTDLYEGCWNELSLTQWEVRKAVLQISIKRRHFTVHRTLSVHCLRRWKWHVATDLRKKDEAHAVRSTLTHLHAHAIRHTHFWCSRRNIICSEESCRENRHSKNILVYANFCLSPAPRFLPVTEVTWNLWAVVTLCHGILWANTRACVCVLVSLHFCADEWFDFFLYIPPCSWITKHNYFYLFYLLLLRLSLFPEVVLVF